jgi:hypothetical protein
MQRSVKPMKNINLPENYPPPVVIGGVGGSGTRLITLLLTELGFFMGNDLNDSYDNLWFTLLFKRKEIIAASDDDFTELVDIFLKGMTGSNGFTRKQISLIKHLAADDRKKHSKKWLKKRVRTLLSKKAKLQPNTRWGWKEPNAHIVVDRLLKYFRDMKYIHVTRNGLDMAHSSNQNQLEFWGHYILGENYDNTPCSSLEYWCITHRRVLEIGKSMGTNFLLLNYDNFCSNPESGAMELCAFLELDAARVSRASLLDLVHTPGSIGRFKQYGTNIFSAEDVAYVKKLGFDVGEK